MKNTIGKYTLCFFAIGLFASCAKNLKPGDTIPGIPKRFSDLKVGNSFTWNTSKSIKVNVNGFAGDSPIRETLEIKGKNIPGNYYRGNHLMSEDLSVRLNIPTALDSLVVVFGSLVKTYPINGGEMDVDYVVNYPEITE